MYNIINVDLNNKKINKNLYRLVKQMELKLLLLYLKIFLLTEIIIQVKIHQCISVNKNIII